MDGWRGSGNWTSDREVVKLSLELNSEHTKKKNVSVLGPYSLALESETPPPALYVAMSSLSSEKIW